MASHQNRKERQPTALITGANKGIGFSAAVQLLQQGYYVYLGARDPVKGAQAKENLSAMGLADFDIIPIDVTADISVAKAAAWLAGKEDILDVLINNAGIGGPQPQRSSSVDPAVLQTIFATNFTGAVRVTRAVLPLLRRSKAPRIVNVSSELGSLWFHERQNADYYATDLTNHAGHQTPEEGARIIVEYATLPAQGPSGQFFGHNGRIPW